MCGQAERCPLGCAVTPTYARLLFGTLLPDLYGHMQLLALLCLALYGGVSPSIAQQARLASSTALADYFDPRRHGGSMLAHFEAYNHVGEPLNVTGL